MGFSRDTPPSPTYNRSPQGQQQQHLLHHQHHHQQQQQQLQQQQQQHIHSHPHSDRFTHHQRQQRQQSQQIQYNGGHLPSIKDVQYHTLHHQHNHHLQQQQPHHHQHQQQQQQQQQARHPLPQHQSPHPHHQQNNNSNHHSFNQQHQHHQQQQRQQHQNQSTGFNGTPPNSQRIKLEENNDHTQRHHEGPPLEDELDRDDEMEQNDQDDDENVDELMDDGEDELENGDDDQGHSPSLSSQTQTQRQAPRAAQSSDVIKQEPGATSVSWAVDRMAASSPSSMDGGRLSSTGANGVATEDGEGMDDDGSYYDGPGGESNGGVNNGMSKKRTTAAKHKCPQCDKYFTRPFNLKSHQRTHTQERPFVWVSFQPEGEAGQCV
ncbi:hypothetical protein BGZ94_004460 [Podila epigama]|nr:hypothetical protein BGZ94_004460 [Podila epigama]